MDKNAAVAPFDNPSVVRRQKITAKASFKAFNAVAMRLLEQLTRLYPHEITIRTLCSMLSAAGEAPSTARKGATIFFDEIRKPCKREDGTVCQYIDLLVSHSDLAFADPMPVKIFQDMDMPSKWADMEPQLKSAMWEYIDRLVHLSTQAVFSGSTARKEMNELSRAVLGAAASGKCATPHDLVEDSDVRVAADRFVNTVK